MSTTEERLHQITELLQLLARDFRRDDAIAPETALLQPSGASDEAIGVLDSTIRATERAAAAATEAIAEHTMQKLLELHRRRNELCPVHRLPNETLSHIFELAVHIDNLEPWRRPRFPRDLVRVSRQWRRVAMSSPRLWTNIAIDEGQESLSLLESYILNSKQTPLDIRLFFNTKKFQPLPYVSLVTPHIHRWRSFDFRHSPAETIIPHLSTPAPMLEMLYLDCAWRQTLEESDLSITDLNLFSGQTPRLRQLSLTGVFIPWNSSVYSGLTALSLKRMEYHKGDSVQQLLQVLFRLPTLESVNLEWLTFSAATFNSTDPFINLPRLNNLRIRVDQMPVVFHILSRLTIPPTSALKVVADLPTDGLLDSFIPPQSEAQSNLPNLRTTCHLDIEYDLSSSITISGTRETGQAVFSFSLSDSNRDEYIQRVIRSLGRTFEMPLLESVTFQCGEFFLEYPVEGDVIINLSDLFERHSTIKQITFQGCAQDVVSILLPTEDSQLLCPRLEKLNIHSSKDLDDACLQKIVESRTIRAPAQRMGDNDDDNDDDDDDAPEVELPARLTRLLVEDCPKVGMATILALGAHLEVVHKLGEL